MTPIVERTNRRRLESVFNSTLWSPVLRFQRLTRWKRVVLTAAWTVAVTTAVYLWSSAFDCPFC